MVEIEVDNRVFDLALQKSRHEELKGIFNAILKSVQKSDPNTSIIEGLGKRLDDIAKNLTQIKPIDTSKTDQKVLDLLELNLQEIKALNKTLNVKREWEFSIDRSFDGTIKKINAVQL